MHQPAERGQGGVAHPVDATDARTTCAARFAELLRERGLHPALGYLNARTRYRFTGLYHADPPLLHNIGLFDRENPDIDPSGAVTQLDETYCDITCATAKPFVTADALNDTRLETHAARDSILSYAGVPIRLGSGRTWGSLCHFDLRPRLLSTEELAALGTVAPVVAEWLSVSREGR